MAEIPRKELSLKDLPAEIIQHIASLACDADGRMGCMLARVSHHIADASSSVRFHSAYARGNRSMQLLYDRLQSLPPRHRRVHHLFLSDDHQAANSLPDVMRLILDVVALVAPGLRTFYCIC